MARQIRCRPAGLLRLALVFLPICAWTQAVSVTIASHPANARFTITGTGCAPSTYSAPQALSWIPGSTCTIRFEPPPTTDPQIRYAFARWQDGVVLNPRVFTAPAQSTSYTALFSTEYRLEVLVNPAGGGSVTAPQWVAANTEATLTAVPAAGYRFAGWHGVDEAAGATAKARYDRLFVQANFLPASTALNTRYAVIPVIRGSYEPPVLNDYGQVAQPNRAYGTWVELWSPQTPNSNTGTLARIPFEPNGAPVLLNNHGQIAGRIGLQMSVWSPATPNTGSGSITEFGSLPTHPSAFTDFGQFGGFGYMWAPSTANGTAGVLVEDARFSGLQDMNNHDQAVMYMQTEVNGIIQGSVTLFTPSAPRSGSGTFTTLPSPTWGTYVGVTGINSSGIIAGSVCRRPVCEQRMFLWRPSSPNGSSGALEIVTPPAGIADMTPQSMNDSGDVVGRMTLEGLGRRVVPFLYRNGTTYDLTTADPVFTSAVFLRINSAGQMAFSEEASSNPYVKLATPAAALPPPAANAVSITITAGNEQRVFTVSGAGCQPGTYSTPGTLLWTPGASCTVAFASPFVVASGTRSVFVNWQDGNATNPRVFAAPSQAATYSADFNVQHLVTAITVPANGGTVSGTGWLTEGSSATLKATPASGYRFLAWWLEQSDTITVSVTGPMTLRAAFTPITTVLPAGQYAVVPIASSAVVKGPRVINDYGQIAGSQAYRTHFLWTPSSPNSISGSLVELSSLFGSPAEFPRINGRGQIAARYGSGLSLWSPASANSTTGTASWLGFTAGAPVAINNYGQVALADHTGPVSIWAPSGPNSSSGTMARNSEWSGVIDLNDAGQMLVWANSGVHLFTPTARGALTGALTPIPESAGTGQTTVALNAAGLVAGHRCSTTTVDTFNCDRRVFIVDPLAAAEAAVIEPPPGFASMVATAMNDHGDIVGHMNPTSGDDYPFLYTNGVVYDLSTASPLLRGGTADGINNAGQVVVNVNDTVYLVSPAGATPRPPAAALTLSHSEVRFGGTAGAPATGQQQIQVTLTGTSAASTSWSAVANQQWITVSPAAGTGSGGFLITLSGAASASPGTIEGAVTVTAGIVTRTVRVVVTFAAAAATRPPFGVLDLPTNYANVSGAIGVTGWALDDTEVVRIEVWRRAVPGEPHMNGQVYIGQGIFVDGARPDVAKANPGVPFNTRGGWGMQILTNMLPNAAGAGPLGNGQHQLFVYAVDREDKSTLLGSRFINVNNATAARPFGTIATPPSGGTASGVYTNFGWALTPQPAMIPFDGSTMWVFVDGVSQGHPTYNQYRADIATLFPGLQNSNGGVGYYHLDTTRLANGMHSIAWSVTDNLNRIEGIGSRLFFVQNPGVAAASSGAASKGMRSSVREGVWFRTGYDPAAPLHKLEGNVIEVEQGGRIELHVDGATSVEFDGNSSLPVGSTFEDGIFYWQVDTAYIASYELKFRNADATRILRVTVRTR